MIKKLFGLKPKPPVNPWENAELGQAHWNEDYDGWIGVTNGVNYLLPSHKSGEPNKKLVQYAQSMVGNPSMFADLMTQARNEATRTFSEYLKPEIEALQPGMVHFSLETLGPCMTVNMLGGSPERPWSIQYRDLESLGLTYKQ